MSVYRCVCGKRKAETWHLLCPPCWAKIPESLQTEVYAACREEAGGVRHTKAVRECLTILNR